MNEQEKMLNERLNKKIHSYTEYRKDRNGNSIPYHRYYFSYNNKKYLFTSEAEAREKYKRLFYGEPEQVKAKNTPSTDITVEQAIKDWFVSYAKAVKPSTAARAYMTVKNTIIPAVGSIKVLEITTADIQQMCNSCATTGSAKKAYEYLRRFYKEKHYLHRFEISPFDAVNYKQYEPHMDKQIFNDKEIADICDEAINYKTYKYGYIFYLLAMTGMRVGEARALRIRDFIFDNKGNYKLAIDETVNEGVKFTNFDEHINTTELLTPKTKSSARTIPISSDIFEEFLKYKHLSRLTSLISSRHEYDDRADEFVFANRNGNPANHKQIYKEWNELLQACGIPKRGRTLHSLRHTFATRRTQEGTPPKQLSQYLGHSDTRTTEQIYAHTQPEELREHIVNYPMNEPREDKK